MEFRWLRHSGPPSGKGQPDLEGPGDLPWNVTRGATLYTRQAPLGLGLAIEGDGAGGLINIDHARGVKLRRLEVRDAPCDAIMLALYRPGDPPGETWRAEIAVDDVEIEDVLAHGNARVPLTIPGSISDLTVKRCTFVATAPYGACNFEDDFDLEGLFYHITNVRFSDCIFRGGGYGFSLGAGPHRPHNAMGIRGLVFEHCAFVENGNHVYVQFTPSPLSGVAFRCCTFLQSVGRAVVIEAGQGVFRGCRFLYNSVRQFAAPRYSIGGQLQDSWAPTSCSSRPGSTSSPFARGRAAPTESHASSASACVSTGVSRSASSSPRATAMKR